MLWKNPSVHDEYVLLSLVIIKLTSLKTGKKYRWGDQNKDDGKEKGGIRSHQPDAEETGKEWGMLIKVLPRDRAQIRNMS